MKFFALLLSSLAVASTAFAAAPEANSGLVRMNKTSLEPTQVSSNAPAYGKKLSEQSLTKSKKIAAKAPAKAPALSVSYQEPEGLFALGLSEQRNGFQNISFRRGPAYTPLKWTNTSTGATEFEWEMFNFSTGETSIYKTVDFERSEIWCTEDGPILYGMDTEGNAGMFQMGAENISDSELSGTNIVYFFGGPSVVGDDDIDLGMTTYMHGQNGGGYIGIEFMQFANDSEDVDPITHIDPIFTDPDGFDLKNPRFIAYANRFHAPAAPYLISKMWCWMSVAVNKPTVVEMHLYKIDEDGTVSDEVLASGSLSIAPGDDLPTMPFKLHAMDENGLETDELIVIDSAFLAVMTFNNDDIDQVYPVCGGGAVYPADEKNPYTMNGYMMLEDEGEILFVRPPFSYYSDNSRTKLCAATDWLWMVDALFPWTYAVDDVKVAQVPIEGGTASFNISSYIGIQNFNYYLPEGCDWIDFDNATIENQEPQCQVLNIPVAALPEGVEGRSAEIYVEGIGTDLTITVNQMNDFEYEGILYTIINSTSMTCKTKDSGNKYAGDLVIPDIVYSGSSQLRVVEIGSQGFIGSSNLNSISLPSTIESIGNDAFAGCDRLTSLIWRGDQKMPSVVLESIDNPNLLVYVDSAKFAPEGLDHNIVADGVCDRLVLTPGYPFTPVTEFTAKTSSMTKEFKQITGIGGCSGWETIVLPFDVAKVISPEGHMLLPYSSVTDARRQRPYWLYEADPAGEWQPAEGIKADVPYLVSMPNNPRYNPAYNISGPVTFSNPTPQRITPETTAPYAVTWASGREFRSLWLPLDETQAAVAMGLNVNIDNLTDDNGEVLAPGSVFHAGIVPQPLEAYVTRYGGARAFRISGIQSAVLTVPDSEDLKITYGEGILFLQSSGDRMVDIYSADGTLLRRVTLKADQPVYVDDLPQGVCLIAGRKVMIR